MRLITFFLITILFLALSCKSENKINDQDKELVVEDVQQSVLDGEKKQLDSKKLEGGLKITWHEHGSGDSIKQGDVVMIDYKVQLIDGTVIDGNHLIEKPSFPFMVGFGMQTPGWDIALKEMKVGDFATVHIPAPLARGDQSIEGLLPANSDNILIIRILDKRKPNKTVDGVKVWIIEENKNNKVKFNESNTIVFHTIISSPSSPRYFDSFRDGLPFEMKLEDQGLVPGIKKALINAKKADRMYVFVPASEAYGSKGYLNLVKANESLFYNLLVMEVLDK